MAKKVFIAAIGQNCGKTTMSVALMHLARKNYPKVGFIKPVGPKTLVLNDLIVDKDAVLMAETFALTDDMSTISPVTLPKNFPRDFLHGKVSATSLEDSILRACHHLEEHYDFLVIEGAGHGGVGSVIELSNARVARLLEAPVILVTEGGVGSVIDAVSLNLALLEREGAETRIILANKLHSEKRFDTLELLKLGLEPKGLKVIGGFDYSPLLANPTFGHVAQLLQLPLRGEQAARNRIIYNIQLGAAASQRVIDSLLEATLLIVTSSRDELIVTLASLYHIPDYRQKIAGLVIAGFAPVSPISKQILVDSAIPHIRVHRTTADVFTILQQDVAKITAEDQEKLSWIKTNADATLDFSVIDALL